MAALPAAAGPWLREEGAGYGRLAIARENVDGLDAWRHDVYGEYGLSPAWTLTVKAEQIRFDDAGDFDAEGARATLRRQLWQGERLILSAEFGAVHGAAIGGVTGCDRLGGEARLSLGASGAREGREWYAFVDVARRVHAEDCWRDRLELGVGREIAGNLFFINQLWLERGSEEARSDKLETALMYRAGAFDLSLAWREELSGRFDEDGVVVALARRF